MIIGSELGALCKYWRGYLPTIYLQLQSEVTTPKESAAVANFLSWEQLRHLNNDDNGFVNWEKKKKRKKKQD